MEAWYASDWHLHDPGFEIMQINEQGSRFNIEELSRNEDLVL